MLGPLRHDFAVYGPSQKGIARVYLTLTTLGFWVVFWYRIARALMRLGALGRLLSRPIELLVHITSGCHLNPRAAIGGGLYLPHATSIVIGGNVVLGRGCTVYQSVTLGSDHGAVPTLGDNVTVYPNAIIFGGIKVGNGATVGAGSVLFRDVPDNGTAVGNPAHLA